MPSKLRVTVERARDLPIVDKHDLSTDAYAEVKIAEEFIGKTETIRKSLNPSWAQGRFEHEVSNDSLLQDAPLEIKVLDQDMYTSELIGVCFIDLSPLLMQTATAAADKKLAIGGWFPLFDATHGIRGSIFVSIRLQFIGNDNQFRDSSAGVQFFSSSSLSSDNYIVQEILGFVSEMLVEDEEPDNTYLDFLKKHYVSNNARIKLLYQLNSEVRREIGKKVIDLGGNAVLGYTSHFEVEGSRGTWVGRAYGTACKLLKIEDIHKKGNSVVNNSINSKQEDPSKLNTFVATEVSKKVSTTDQSLPIVKLPANFQRSSRPYVDTVLVGYNLSELSVPSVLDASDDEDVNNNKNLSVSSNFNTDNGNVSPVVSTTVDDNETFPMSNRMKQSDEIKSSNAQKDASLSVLLAPSSRSNSAAINRLYSTSSLNAWSTAGVAGSGGSNQMHSLFNYSNIKRPEFLSSLNFAEDGLIVVRPIGNQHALLLPVRSFGPTSDGRYNEFDCTDATGKGLNNLFNSQDVMLLSLMTLPPHIHYRLGGLVIARSVKYLASLDSEVNSERADEMREGWWSDLRREIQDHARIMCCTHIIGYRENCTVYGDVCVLSATGTAAVLKNHIHPFVDFISDQAETEEYEDAGLGRRGGKRLMPRHSLRAESYISDVFNSTGNANPTEATNEASDIDKRNDTLDPCASGQKSNIKRNRRRSGTFVSLDSANSDSDAEEDVCTLTLPKMSKRRFRRDQKACSFVHIPYKQKAAPFAHMRIVPCLCCRRKWVPESILCTTELPERLQIKGKGVFVEARVCRMRTKRNENPNSQGLGEADAVNVSEQLIWLEFDVQRQLMMKLKMLHMNGAFGYTSNISIGTEFIIATATCTAVYVEALPSAALLQLGKNLSPTQLKTDDRLANMKTDLEEIYRKNREEHEKAINLSNESEEEIKRILKELYQSSSNRNARKNSKSRKCVAHTGEGSGNDSGLESDGSSSSSTSSSSSSSSSSSDDESDSDRSGDGDGNGDGDDDDSLDSPSESSGTGSNSSNSDDDDDHDKDEGQRSKVAKKRAIKRASMQANVSPLVEDNQLRNALRRRERRQYKDDRPPIVVEIEDDTDADMLSVLHDWETPVGIEMTNLSNIPGSVGGVGAGKSITIVNRAPVYFSSVTKKASHNRRGTMVHNTNNAMVGSVSSGGGSGRGVYSATNTSAGGSPFSGQVNNGFLNRSEKESIVMNTNMYGINPKFSSGTVNLSHALTNVYRDSYIRLCYQIRNMMPCFVVKLLNKLNILDDGIVELITTAHVFKNINRLPIHVSSALDFRVTMNKLKNEQMATRHTSLTAANSTETLSNMFQGRSFSSSKAILSREASAEEIDGKNKTLIRTNSTSEQYNNGNAYFNESTENSPNKLFADGSNNYSSGIPIPVGPGGGKPTFTRGDSNSPQSQGLTTLPSHSPTSQQRRNSPLQLSDILSSSPGTFASYLGIASGHVSANTGISGTDKGDGADVILTPLLSVSNHRIRRYLGPVQLYFVKTPSTGQVKESFTHTFINEVVTSVKAQVKSLGGNALLSYSLESLDCDGKMFGNQIYRIVSVKGDAVLLEQAITYAGMNYINNGLSRE